MKSMEIKTLPFTSLLGKIEKKVRVSPGLKPFMLGGRPRLAASRKKAAMSLRNLLTTLRR